MDPFTLLSLAAALTAVTPVVRRMRDTRAARRDALRYLEALLVEARCCSFPNPRSVRPARRL